MNDYGWDRNAEFGCNYRRCIVARLFVFSESSVLGSVGKMKLLAYYSKLIVSSGIYTHVLAGTFITYMTCI